MKLENEFHENSWLLMNWNRTAVSALNEKRLTKKLYICIIPILTLTNSKYFVSDTIMLYY